MNGADRIISPPETLVLAVMDVLAGRIAVSPDIDHELALSRLTGETAAADDLTAREFEVLGILLAERGNFPPKTIANLHSLIQDELGVSSDIELVRLALRQGTLTQIYLTRCEENPSPVKPTRRIGRSIDQPPRGGCRTCSRPQKTPGRLNTGDIPSSRRRYGSSLYCNSPGHHRHPLPPLPPLRLPARLRRLLRRSALRYKDDTSRDKPYDKRDHDGPAHDRPYHAPQRHPRETRREHVHRHGRRARHWGQRLR